MADVPPECDDPGRPEPTDEEASLLSALWDRLEHAQTLSSSGQAMDALPEILRLCEEAVALIRAQLLNPD